MPLHLLFGQHHRRACENVKATAFQVLMARLNVVPAVDPRWIPARQLPQDMQLAVRQLTLNENSIVSYVGSGPWSLRMSALLDQTKDPCSL